MKTVALGEIANINPRLGRTMASDEPVSFVPMAYLSDQSAAATPESVRPFGEVSKGYTPMLDGDLLVAKITPCFENGKIGQAQLTTRVGMGSTEFHVVRPSAEIDARYLLHFLRTPRVNQAGRLRMTGSGGQRRVPAAYLEELGVPLPPIDEQRRIAAILDQVGRLASRTQQAADGVDRLPASIFRQMELRGFPEVALGDIVASSQIGLVRSAAQLGDRGSFEYVRMDAISSAGRWRPTMFRRTEATPVEVDKYSVRDGDLLLNTRNTRELVGKAAVYRGPVRLYNNNLMRLRFHEGIAPEYIHGYLWSRTGRQQLEQMKSGTTSVFAVYARDLMSLRLPLPPVDVQQRFSEAVRRVEERRWELERRHVQLSKLGLTLQARAFTGEL